MEKRGLKEWVVRSIIHVIGLIIAHLGVTLFLPINGKLVEKTVNKIV